MARGAAAQFEREAACPRPAAGRAGGRANGGGEGRGDGGEPASSVCFRVGAEERCRVAMASNAASLNAVRETMDGG